MGRRNPKQWTNEEYEKKRERQSRELEQAKREKEIFDQRREIRETKREMRRIFPATNSSKAYVRYVLGNCTAIEVYAAVVMWVKDDLSALYALIGAVVTEGFALAVYAAKAYLGKREEENVKLERDRMTLGLDIGEEETEDSEPDREAAMG